MRWLVCFSSSTRCHEIVGLQLYSNAMPSRLKGTRIRTTHQKQRSGVNPREFIYILDSLAGIFDFAVRVLRCSASSICCQRKQISRRISFRKISAKLYSFDFNNGYGDRCNLIYVCTFVNAQSLSFKFVIFCFRARWIVNS